MNPLLLLVLLFVLTAAEDPCEWSIDGRLVTHEFVELKCGNDVTLSPSMNHRMDRFLVVHNGKWPTAVSVRFEESTDNELIYTFEESVIPRQVAYYGADLDDRYFMKAPCKLPAHLRWEDIRVEIGWFDVKTNKVTREKCVVTKRGE